MSVDLGCSRSVGLGPSRVPGAVRQGWYSYLVAVAVSVLVFRSLALTLTYMGFCA